MEATIIIKYGLSEEDAIDITNQVLSSYVTKNIINIPSNELETFTQKYYTTWLNANIESLIKKGIDTRILTTSQKIFININVKSDTMVRNINFVSNINKSTNVNINLAKICKNNINKNNIII